jgi:stage IV sporulation protein B
MIPKNGSNDPYNLAEGSIVGASIQSLLPGKRGEPGEKVGIIHSERCLSGQFFSGNISKNTKVGVFGHMTAPPATDDSEMLMTLPANQIREGPVEILTVLENDRVERFSGEIVKINLKSTQSGKGLVIKITDPRLLEQAGGIIQGMSGSRIIQNGRLVGAVTHVYVNDPTKGYGVPLEWMLQEAGIGALVSANKMVS